MYILGHSTSLVELSEAKNLHVKILPNIILFQVVPGVIKNHIRGDSV